METKTILLVEDNPDDEKLTLRALRRHKIANEVIVARDGEEALECLFGSPASSGTNDLPQLVLLDLKPPKISGFEVLERVRTDARTKLVPVVILTTSDEDEDMIRGYTLGANSFVRKPVDFEQFSRAVEQLGLYWLLLNQSAVGK